MVNLANGVSNYFFFVGVLNMFSLVGLTTAHLVVSLLKRELMVRDLMLLILLFLILLGGYVFQISRMTSFLSNMSGLSPTRWCFEGIMNWKFSMYEDGDVFLNPLGFGTFHYIKTFSIIGNFLIFGNCLFILTLIQRPCLLKRKVDTSEYSSNKTQRSMSEDDDDTFPENVAVNMFRTSSKCESIKPALFMRESSVTGNSARLSVNLSCTGKVLNAFII